MAAAGALGMCVNGEMSWTHGGNWKVAAPNNGPSRMDTMTTAHDTGLAHRGSRAVAATTTPPITMTPGHWTRPASTSARSCPGTSPSTNPAVSPMLTVKTRSSKSAPSPR